MGDGTSRAALSAWTSSSGWSLDTASPGATLTAFTSTLSTLSLSAGNLISLAISPLGQVNKPQNTRNPRQWDADERGFSGLARIRIQEPLASHPRKSA